MAKRKAEENGHALAAPVVEEPPPDTKLEEQKNTPCHVIRFGFVKATVWANQTERGTMYNVTVTRIYKGADDHWYNSASFGYRDLLTLAKCLDHAHTWISEAASGSSDVPF